MAAGSPGGLVPRKPASRPGTEGDRAERRPASARSDPLRPRRPHPSRAIAGRSRTSREPVRHASRSEYHPCARRAPADRSGGSTFVAATSSRVTAEGLGIGVCFFGSPPAHPRGGPGEAPSRACGAAGDPVHRTSSTGGRMRALLRERLYVPSGHLSLRSSSSGRMGRSQTGRATGWGACGGGRETFSRFRR